MAEVPQDELQFYIDDSDDDAVSGFKPIGFHRGGSVSESGGHGGSGGGGFGGRPSNPHGRSLMREYPARLDREDTSLRLRINGLLKLK